MVEHFKNISKSEGIWSRLPVMTEQEVEMIKGSADFFGVNYYSSRLVRPKQAGDDLSPHFDTDMNVKFFQDESWLKGSTTWMYVVPEGLYDLLMWIRDKYNNPTVFITENGFPDLGGMEDIGRINYAKHHLAAVARAIKNKCNIIGYTHWSLLDNFEWTDGYVQKFGLFYVDINSEEKDRIPKKSAQFFKELIVSKKFEL